MPSRPRSSAGFTLVEILIVIVVMSILAVAIIPSAAPSVTDQLTSAAQIVAADLAYGRSLAVLNNDRYQFQFDRQNNQYTLSYSGSNSALATLPPSPFQSSQDPASQYVVRLAKLPQLGVPVTLYDVQALTPQPVETTTVEFGSLGSTTQTQPTTIWLSAGAGTAARFISVSVNPSTGLATVGSFQGTIPPAASAATQSSSSSTTSTSTSSPGSGGSGLAGALQGTTSTIIQHGKPDFASPRIVISLTQEFARMIARLKSRRVGPIGLDIGSQCVKLIQFNWDQEPRRRCGALGICRPKTERRPPEQRWQQVAAAIRQAHERRHFRGREVVIGLGAPELFVQNVRVAKVSGGEMDKIVRHEAAGRLPFAIDDAEVRFIEAADVKQGDVTKREVILLACQRATLAAALAAVDEAGLHVAAVDVEPAALLRCYAQQFRRDEDQQQRALFAHLGATSSVVVIAKGTDVLFIKYIDVGGRQLDEAVGRHLEMTLSEAATLRRHNGDRRIDQQDPEITRSISEATRPVVERLATELARLRTIPQRHIPRPTAGADRHQRRRSDAGSGRCDFHPHGSQMRTGRSAANV